MKTFGVTGGIGMGKSACTQFIQARGLPIIDTDQLAREVVKPGEPALDEITREFGVEVLDAGGVLLRDRLAALVFTDASARARLERILHPRIRNRWRSQVQEWTERRIAFSFVVIPLLFETGAEKELAGTICVACSDKTQRDRLGARGWTPGETERRLAAQWPAETKLAKSDFVIWSEGSLEIHAAQLDRILFHIGALSA